MPRPVGTDGLMNTKATSLIHRSRMFCQFMNTCGCGLSCRIVHVAFESILFHPRMGVASGSSSEMMLDYNSEEELLVIRGVMPLALLLIVLH